MHIQSIELGLIRDDAKDLHATIFSTINHEYSGYISLALSSTIGFFVEESHNYLASRNLINETELSFIQYKESVKKLRTLIKMFDDSQGGMHSLVNLLNLFQEKTTLLMNVGKRGLKGFISKKLQPNIGIYFLDQYPIYIATGAFLAAGKTKEEIESLQENNIKEVSEQAKSYGVALGEYFALLSYAMYPNKNEIDFQSKILALENLKISHNDFHSKDFYSHITKEFLVKEEKLAPAIFFILTQVNIAYHLLPRLLSSESSLLTRIQFLTAYHATRSILEIKDEIYIENDFLKNNESFLKTIPNIKKVRNILAHYGFGEGKKYIQNASDPLNDIVLGFCGKSKSDLIEISRNQLNNIILWSQDKVSKLELKRLRALFGDHT